MGLSMVWCCGMLGQLSAQPTSPESPHQVGLSQAGSSRRLHFSWDFFFFPFLKAVSSLKAVFCTSASEESGENLGRVLLAGELQLLLCVLAAGAAEIV